MTAAQQVKQNNPKNLITGQALKLMQERPMVAERAVYYVVNECATGQWETIHKYWVELTPQAQRDIVNHVYSRNVAINKLSAEDKARYFARMFGISLE